MLGAPRGAWAGLPEAAPPSIHFGGGRAVLSPAFPVTAPKLPGASVAILFEGALATAPPAPEDHAGGQVLVSCCDRQHHVTGLYPSQGPLAVV